MDSVGEKGEAGQGLQGLWGQAAEQLGDAISELPQGGEEEAGEVILEVAPQAFNRIEFRAVRGQEKKGDIGGQAQGVGLVKGAII